MKFNWTASVGLVLALLTSIWSPLRDNYTFLHVSGLGPSSFKAAGQNLAEGIDRTNKALTNTIEQSERVADYSKPSPIAGALSRSAAAEPVGQTYVGSGQEVIGRETPTAEGLQSVVDDFVRSIEDGAHQIHNLASDLHRFQDAGTKFYASWAAEIAAISDPNLQRDATEPYRRSLAAFESLVAESDRLTRESDALGMDRESMLHYAANVRFRIKSEEINRDFINKRDEIARATSSYRDRCKQFLTALRSPVFRESLMAQR
jgi:hypothetical protein